MVALQDFVPLKPAEQKLLAVASTGKQCSFGRARPLAPAHDNHLRADFVRFLALGCDAAATVHESGGKAALDRRLHHKRGIHPEGLVQRRSCSRQHRLPGRYFLVAEGLQSKDFAAPGEAFSEDAVSLVNAEAMGALMLAPIRTHDGGGRHLERIARSEKRLGYAFVPPWGTNALVLTELVFGWVASLLAVAAFSGLVKTD
jgi:hypothetical protein